MEDAGENGPKRGIPAAMAAVHCACIGRFDSAFARASAVC